MLRVVLLRVIGFNEWWSLIMLQCEFILGLNFVFKINEGKICFVNFDNRDAFFAIVF